MAKRKHADAHDPDEDGHRSTKLRKTDLATQVSKATPNQTKLHLQSLPDELLLRILSFLPVADLIKTHRYVLTPQHILVED